MKIEKLKIDKYRYIGKGALVASFELIVPELGIAHIRGTRLFQKDGKRWISLPCEEIEKEGKKKYFPYLYFEDKEFMMEFSKKALQAIDDDAFEKSRLQTNEQDLSEVPF